MCYNRTVNEALCQEISEAFRDVKLGGGTGLFEAQGRDDYESAKECAEHRACDEKEDWARLRDEDLNDCNSYFGFANAEGTRFHLPAFLLLDLRGAFCINMAPLLTDESLYPKFRLLNSAQRAAVRTFLSDVAEREAGGSETSFCTARI